MKRISDAIKSFDTGERKQILPIPKSTSEYDLPVSIERANKITEIHEGRVMRSDFTISFNATLSGHSDYEDYSLRKSLYDYMYGDIRDKLVEIMMDTRSGKTPDYMLVPRMEELIRELSYDN